MIRVTHGEIARITLDAPARHNALSVAGMVALDAALTEVAEARVVILTGVGKSFCAGVDLGNVATRDFTDNPLTDLCDRLERLAPVTICALNGGVYGGGVELALSCDFRLGVEGVKAHVPAAELGIHYTQAGMARAVRTLGLQPARRMFLACARFDAAALEACGFLDAAPVARLEDLAETWAARLAGLAPLALSGMKRSLVELARGTSDHEDAQARVAACFASDDHREALAARAEKRPPRFQGR